MSKSGYDYRSKRLLSPESAGITTTETPNEKKQRQEELRLNEINPLDLTMAENEMVPRDLHSWMMTISAQLKMTTNKSDLENLATKTDLLKMNDTIVAQGEEITQIREELQQHKKDLDNMRSVIDENEARNLNRKYESAGFTEKGRVNNMADQRGNPTIDTQSTRKNLVAEGIKGDQEIEMIADFLRITAEIGSVVYKTDIESVTRLNRRDSTNPAPGPVLIRFNRIAVRDSVLKNKFNLRKMENMQSVYINADEPVHIRRTKAVFRRVANRARSEGEDVELRHNYVKIGMTTFTLNDLHRIPSKFLPDKDVEPTWRGNLTSATKEPEVRPDSESKEEGATAGPSMKPGLIREGEKMRIVDAGILFSGPTAYPSNLHYADITFEDKDYICNEQAYQCTMAEVHEEPELAKHLKGCTNAWAIKVDSTHVKTTKEWKEGSPKLLWKLLDIKMTQHPELLERLIDTAPYRLIEASTSERWGGGAPFESTLYDTGKFTGKNEFGDLATGYRDQKIRERAEKKMETSSD